MKEMHDVYRRTLKRADSIFSAAAIQVEKPHRLVDTEESKVDK